jgi:hypothetical protein
MENIWARPIDDEGVLVSAGPIQSDRYLVPKIKIW